jgi:hypothetical protein
MHTPSRFPGRVIWIALLGAAVLVSSLPLRGADKRIVLIAGRPSHPPGMHEFRAGCLLFQKALASVPGITVQVYDNGCPRSSWTGRAWTTAPPSTTPTRC